MSITLYHATSNRNSVAVQVTANYVGQGKELVLQEIQPSELKKGDVGSANIFRKLPFATFRVHDTVVPSTITISQPLNIVRYQGSYTRNATLTGTGAADAVQVDEWLECASTDLAPLCDGWCAGTNRIPFTKAPIIRLLDTHFKSHTYIAGNSVTVADIVVASTLLETLTKFFDTKAQKELLYLDRWARTMYEQPQFSTVIGEVTFPTEAVSINKEAPPKPAPKQQQQPQQQQQKKQAEPAESAPKPAPKPVNPLTLLPPSSMVLDDVKHDFFRKRPYNNEYFPEKFWQQFDPNGYTIYLTEYQYPEDLDKDAYTNNLATGFFSRCEVTAKFCFAVANVVQLQDHQYQILGAFIVRGPGINAELEDVSDFEEYTFEKLDPSNEEHRRRFNERMVSQDTIDNYKLLYKQYLK